MLAKDLSVLLAQRAEDIASMLLPNGKKKGNEWCAGSIDGEQGKSLKVHLVGSKAGVWSDFEGGDSGDLLDLWAKTKRLSINEAMKEVREYFNLSSPRHYRDDSKNKFTRPPKKHLEALKKMSPVHEYLSISRCLDEHIIALYGIPHSEHEIIFNYYRDEELIFIKTLKLERKDGKKEMYVSANSEPCLFGWHVISDNAREIVLCEGEIDAMSFKQFGIDALSVPFGGGRGDKQRWIEYEYDRLNRFDEIYICMDNDSSGREASKEIIERLGAHRCRIVELPMKDANECLVHGISSQDMESFLEEAKTIDPEELKKHIDFRKLTEERMFPIPGKFLGYTLGWSKYEENFLFRPSGLTMWTGFNGHGKTMFLGNVMLNMINQGARFCVASMELEPSELLERTYIQATTMTKPSSGYLDAIDEWMDSKLYIFNLVGVADIKRLLEVFLYARRRYGVDVFIVDSLTTLNIAEDDYTGQKELTNMLRDFKVKHQCHIHLVAHPRKPRDESEIPGKYDIRGAGAVSDLADNCFSVWRNKKKESIAREQSIGGYLTEDEMEVLKQPDAYLRCDKNRHGRGQFKEGVFAFWFHEPSLQYLERDNNRPRKFIEYSCLNES